MSKDIWFYYDVTLNNALPEGQFKGNEDGADITEHWIEIEKLNEIKVYPPQAKDLLEKGGFEHFVYKE